MNITKLWIYVNKELVELKDDFTNIFGDTGLCYDYENVWEWLESTDKNSAIYLNISRIHDWGKADYSKPIIITVGQKGKVRFTEEDIANRIKKVFNCSVFGGEIFVSSDNYLDMKIARKY